MIIAGVDIGTNTLLMLIADVRSDGTMNIIRDYHEIVRLGEGLDAQGHINDAALQRACDCLEKYKTECKHHHVSFIHAVSTSALRRTSDRQTILDRLSAALGSTVECISGEEEAMLTFLGSSLADQACTVVDIGGGSTELIRGHGERIDYRISLEVGALRLRESYFDNGLPSAARIDQARSYVRQLLRDVPNSSNTALVGVAGTPTTMAAVELQMEHFDAARVEGFSLSEQRITELSREFLSTPLDQLRALPGMHPKRADILPSGSLILDEIVRHFKAPAIIVSTRGLRFGLVLQSANRSGTSHNV